MAEVSETIESVETSTEAAQAQEHPSPAPAVAGAARRSAGGTTGRSASNRRVGRRKKRCPLLEAKIDYIDYKDVKLLERFIGENKRILPRRLTGVSPTMQRRLARAIKRAKHLALLPYVQSV